MRLSDFWRLVDEEFGPAYGRSLTVDQVLFALGDRTPAQALSDGLEPRDVWFALCEAMDVPAERRWGRERPKRR
ncbi:Protein of unknown function (DUF3046) [Kineococcus xinjiangensis]|uniref:DUF3046 family protein n=1 Tax=Kineococcus xinjiangensis TaxID=512762 RepID=A0A2S6IVT5_9ACTN|nr:DUF3046 domain-containing protein [Kineococcus xinjiangensis]PPK98472.1 Protein of unknown function (DUF3046) [Kineococcus xinjiangensis]